MPTQPAVLGPVELLTGPQAQQFAKIRKNTLKKWRDRGLRSIGSGKKIRYTKEDIIAFIERGAKPTLDQ